jgi:HAE1 family hydrophobic/amphiphilic exporter-1
VGQWTTRRALENIHRIHDAGVSARESAVRGSSEVSGALIASTLTTVVVFLPIVYVHGVAGLLFKEQALTVSFSRRHLCGGAV